MRVANVLVGVVALIWAALFSMGVGLIYGVVRQHVPGYPNVGQIEYYIVYPAAVTMTLLAGAWLFNGLRRGAQLLALAAGVALVGLIPYLLAYTGGI